MIFKPKHLLFASLLGFVIETGYGYDQETCAVSAPQNCQKQNYDLLDASQSNNAISICETFHRYRECLYSHSAECRDQDFIGGLLSRSCDGKCFDCGGVGTITGSLSTVVVIGTLLIAYFVGFF